MIEQFARTPDGLKPAEGSKPTPIPLDEAVASLSAILLDETYYAFIMCGRREADGPPWVGEDRLIPLKAVAWLELSARKGRGEPVDAKDVRKHLNDVLRLSQLLAANTRIEIDARIAGGLTRFLAAVAADLSINSGALQLDTVTVAELVAQIARAYGIELSASREGGTDGPAQKLVQRGTQKKAKKTRRTYTEKPGGCAKVLARLGKIVRSHYDRADCIADDIARPGYARRCSNPSARGGDFGRGSHAVGR